MASFYKVIVQNAAASDLAGIWEYLAVELKEPETAARILDALDKAVASLRELPERYALLADKLLREKGIHKVPVKNYIVFYKVNEAEKSVAVLRVLHGRRDWEHVL